jgi:hypothetical protein
MLTRELKAAIILLLAGLSVIERAVQTVVARENIMLSRLGAAVVALMAAGLGQIALADQKLPVIATVTIDLAGTGHAIDLRQARGAYRGIRFRAKSGPAEFTRVQIIYADGAIHNEAQPVELPQGERSRAIDETAADRFIDTVNVANAPGKGRVIVDVLGIQTEAGARLQRQAPASGDVTGTAAPAEGSDVMFGYQDVGFGVDRDVIKVGGDLGKFDRIRLRVLGNDVHINALKVVYMDGEKQELAVDADIKADAHSEWFAIRGDRFIREIEMSYRSAPSLKGQARVEVTGEYAGDWLGAAGEGRKYNEGWVLLGAQTAGFTGFDRDTITVGRNEGGFSRLRIEAMERAITLKEIRVKHFEGPDEIFAMSERVDPGKPYGPLEFKGGKAPIKAIEARYRSRFDFMKGLKSVLEGRPAVVQIWGQH